jgi:hypothetical protein
LHISGKGSEGGVRARWTELDEDRPEIEVMERYGWMWVVDEPNPKGSTTKVPKAEIPID